MSLSQASPLGKPVVWSENRQALCDSLWYFKQHQAGSYPIDGVLRGFLLDGESTIRDIVTSDVIISTLGGGRQKDSTTKMSVRVNETRNCIVNQCKEAFKRGVPVAVIIGRKCTLAPVQVLYNYNVLDWFTITDLWIEKDGQNDIFFWKIRLERTDRTTPSWCQPDDALTQTVEPRPFPHGKLDCVHCGVLSMYSFAQGWACLNGNCKQHFTLADGTSLTDLSYAGHSATIIAWCSECKHASKTIFVEGWTCYNRGCSKAFEFPAEVKKNDSLVQRDLMICGHKVEQYFLPDMEAKGQCCGTVLIFRATDAINKTRNGPNHLWMDIQEAAARGDDFKRNAVKCPGTSSEILTRNFQRNWGAPYKFVVAVNSTSFKEAPPYVMQALKRMQWAGRQSVQASNDGFEQGHALKSASMDTKFVDFNELLTIGYMEDDAISYHDDGEDTLGPTVATLSLGSSARMLFAEKTKYNPKTKKGTRSTARNQVLAFPVHHGDMVVMHGAQVHQQYDHKVEPSGKRRFALTCRNIIISKIDEDQQEDAMSKGEIPADAGQWTYDGY
ncbi:hypothetical protein BJF96_g3820 [Verticillium dahliae]|uniref:Fe2OG dioxygenase domain-containing protein n=1 Tax=Verticillium dahliae TaxID=27337 RepID=A0AA45ANC7_VERDA|nr:hypothetical protein BJF96_g3820 [Verticillium dahliae]PNH54931.1 hypothetical protein VD0003_g2633 [Verticillium dahliae]